MKNFNNNYPVVPPLNYDRSTSPVLQFMRQHQIPTHKKRNSSKKIFHTQSNPMTNFSKVYKSNMQSYSRMITKNKASPKK